MLGQSKGPKGQLDGSAPYTYFSRRLNPKAHVGSEMDQDQLGGGCTSRRRIATHEGRWNTDCHLAFQLECIPVDRPTPLHDRVELVIDTPFYLQQAARKQTNKLKLAKGEGQRVPPAATNERTRSGVGRGRVSG